MIIEFELQGSKCLHKGIFDTTGFWVKNEVEYIGADVDDEGNIEWVAVGYKLYSHFSFAFYHEDKEVFDEVYNVLIGVLRGSSGRDIDGIGYIRKLNK